MSIGVDIAVYLRKRMAEVWDEGYLRGVLDQENELERADNPYRNESEAS